MNGGENLFGDRFGLSGCILGRFAKLLEQNHKLVSAQSRYRVGFADAGEDAPSDLLQQEIADVMAEGIVQRLEIIEVDEEQCSLAFASDAGGQGLPQPIQQQATIGQAGQRIKECEIRDLVMCCLELLEFALPSAPA